MNPGFAKLNRTLHWIVSALGLFSLVFFSITGITLNHPDWFLADRSSEFQELQFTSQWQAEFVALDEVGQLNMLARELDERWGLGLPRNIERDEYEWLLDYQRPGGLRTVVLDVEAAVLSYENVSDGLVAIVNDLHKGRHSGLVWVALIDVVAIICVFFGVTGLVLLWVHAPRRSSTWPLVGVGLVVPFIVYFCFVPW